MKTKIDQTKLEELHAFLEADKNAGRKEMEEYLGEDPTPWIEALKETYPEKYVTDDEPEPKEEPVKKKAGRPAKVEQPQSSEVEYFLVENGIKVALTHKATKGNQVILQKVEPKDLVTIKVRGEDVVIDLLKLDREAARLGVPVAQLKMLGDLAKG